MQAAGKLKSQGKTGDYLNVPKNVIRPLSNAQTPGSGTAFMCSYY